MPTSTTVFASPRAKIGNLPPNCYSFTFNGVNWSELPYIKQLKFPASTGEIKKAGIMGRLFKVLVFLILVGFVGLIGYAYLGDMSPDRTIIKQPVTLNAR